MWGYRIPMPAKCPVLLDSGYHNLLDLKVYGRPWRRRFKRTFYRPCIACMYLEEVPRDWRPTYSLDD